VRICSVLSGNLLCSLDVTPMSIVLTLKRAIELATGIPSQQQDLFSGSRLLDDEDEFGPGFFAELEPTLLLYRLTAAAADEREGKRAAMKHILQGGRLSRVREKYTKDEDIVLAAVDRNVCELSSAWIGLLRKPSFMLVVMRKHRNAVYYADKSLWEDRSFVLDAVEIDGLWLRYATPMLQKDFEVVLAAVHQCSVALQHAEESLRNDKQIVMAAVQGKGTALCYAGQSPRCDKDIVMVAVQNDGMAIVHTAEVLKQDPEIRRACRLKSGAPLFQESEMLIVP